jgi:hypothetical protein
MREVDGSVERAYLTSLEELREICKDLSAGNHEYRIVRCSEKEVTISFSDDPTDLNVLCFAFPILPYIWPYGLPCLVRCNEESCRMVCLHVLVGRRTRGGSYPEGGERWKDGITDWERFWPRLEAALTRRLVSESRPSVLNAFTRP